MTTVLSISPSRKVHYVNVKTTKGRVFAIDIYESSVSNYDSEITVLDRISNTASSCVYNTDPASPSSNDNFKAALVLIQDYLAKIDSSDSIAKIHNPCNCPFVSESDQNTIASCLGMSITVVVN